MNAIKKAALLSGTLCPRETLSAKIRQAVSITGHVHLPEGYTFFSGEYSITPSTESRVLATKDRVMHDDVQIAGIPYWETSNEYGTTIIIGRTME